MADILFAGCVAAVALYLLKQKPEEQPGAAANVSAKAIRTKVFMRVAARYTVRRRSPTS